jgi:hypothetical protein
LIYVWVKRDLEWLKKVVVSEDAEKTAKGSTLREAA